MPSAATAATGTNLAAAAPATAAAAGIAERSGRDLAAAPAQNQAARGKKHAEAAKRDSAMVKKQVSSADTVPMHVALASTMPLL